MRYVLPLIGALLVLPATTRAQTVTWVVDPGHSSAEFVVRHMLVANVRGQFDGPKGTVAFDPQNLPGTIAVDAVFQTATINTRNPDRDRDLRSPNFFDVVRYPTIAFKSSRAETTGVGRFTLVGNLTMHGVTKQVTLDVEGPTPAVKDLDGQTRIGATATTTIDRREFGLKYNEILEGGGAVVGNDVRITIDIEVTHK